jgi:hypothetical protein
VVVVVVVVVVMTMVVAIVVTETRSMTLATCLVAGMVMEPVGCVGLALDVDARLNLVVSLPLTVIVAKLMRMAPSFAVNVRILSGTGVSSPSS